MLENLKPEKVFKYFEEISKIPHCSKNEKELSDYIVVFAKERGIKYIQDDALNVILLKEATKGYEDAEPIILQGHMDMVCEKTSDSNHDFEKEPLELIVDGDYITAKDTTLGGDNGIAVAMILALFDEDNISHPKIEAILTTDEETGLFGAESIDVSMLEGKRLINLDSEEEGIFTVSCAGGSTALGVLPISRENVKGNIIGIKVSGLLGGHSGAEIDKERANASKLIGRMLYKLSENFKFVINKAQGGFADNVITKEAYAEIVCMDESISDIMAEIENFNRVIRHEFKAVDPDIKVVAENLGVKEVDAISKVDSFKVLSYLNLLPQGIQNMSMEIDGLVETSLNIGIVKAEDEEFNVTLSVRSSVETRIDEVQQKIINLTKVLGGNMTFDGRYPGWEYKTDSKLRDKMISVYEEMYNEKPEIMAIHAGLECGFFAQKIEDVDCISIGPWLYDVHTPDEKLSISSTQRIWEYLVNLLEQLK